VCALSAATPFPAPALDEFLLASLVGDLRAIRVVNLRLGFCGVRHGSVVARIPRSMESNESTPFLLGIQVPSVVPSTSVLRTPHHNQPTRRARDKSKRLAAKAITKK
jgi:hypothetical protein